MAFGLVLTMLSKQYPTRRFPIAARPDAFKMVACSPTSSNLPTAVSFPVGQFSFRFQSAKLDQIVMDIDDSANTVFPQLKVFLCRIFLFLLDGQQDVTYILYIYHTKTPYNKSEEGFTTKYQD